MIISEYFQMSAFIHWQVIELNKEKNSIKLVCADFTYAYQYQITIKEELVVPVIPDSTTSITFTA